MASTPRDAAQSLAGIDFPCKKSKIVQYAQGKHASQDVLKALKSMPDAEYKSMADVFKGLGHSGSKH